MLQQILNRASSFHGDQTAVVCGSLRLTYQEVAERVARLASVLADLGVGYGERVALLHRNCHRALEAYFAATHIGYPM